MLSQYSYPIICSENFEKTVAFYEDHFDFVPKLEMKGFAILKRENWDNIYLSVIDSNHAAIPEEHKRPVQGLLLNYPVENVVKFYDYAYHEGLTLLSEPKDAACGRKHFYIEDPNGVLIDIAQNIDLQKFIEEQNCDDIYIAKSAP